MYSKLLVLLLVVSKCELAKILAFYPTPSISHQVVFRKLTTELVNKQHEVTVITTDPAFPNKDGPENLTEIDLHDISYEILRNLMELARDDILSKKKTTAYDMNFFYLILFEIQILEVQKVLDAGEQFDLIIVEEISRPSLAISYIYKAPVVLFSSLGALSETLDIFGSHTHPLLYPSQMHYRCYNLTFWEKIEKLYDHYYSSFSIYAYEQVENEALQKYFGSDIPPMKELYKNVHMLFLNIHSIWVDNQPVPPNVIYLGGFHQSEPKELPQDLKQFLDSSKHGVIYVSFGTNALSTILPTDKIEIIADVLGRLPYDVLWKWDKDELPHQPKNIKLSKWFPQADLLRHPKIKLFITQAGLQSTDEAITAEVPLVAFPVFADQWYNAEKYVKHGIGMRLLFEDATEDVVRDAVMTVIEDESYRNNIIKLRELMYDQPQTPIERAMFWIDHVIRHKGATHLRAAGANLSWTEYYEVELLICLLLLIIISLTLIGISASYMYRCIKMLYFRGNKIKHS